MKMNKLVRYLNKIFIKCLRILLIMPMNQKKTCLLLVHGAMIVVVFLTSFYFRYKNNYKTSSIGTVILYSFEEAEEVCGCLAVLVILYSYRQTHLWQNLYKNDIILDDDDQRCHTFIIIAFFLQMCLNIYAAINWTWITLEVDHLFVIILFSLSPFIHATYTIAVHTLYMNIILEIRQKLIKANKQLNSNIVTINLNVMHSYLNQAIEGGKIFNRLFGHQILIFYFQFFLFLINVLLSIIPLMNSQKFITFGDIFQNILLYIYIFILIMVSCGPCGVAFACSMVATEVDKLLADCYEVQENFHYSSHEYKELQTLTLILGSRVLQFTAAKFMEIKQSTILSIMAAAITYFVALVQFF
ncbi:hypothetical protein ABEB36_003959 [Hypothenemus hampei]|uniref:Gustatory receptor n=1 Tax=Hypothenemus hampei TaxID=57062 RepID=A0ABD1F1Q8_HYPHA